MTSDVTIGLAFFAGLISFVSPCVLPLVPAYIGYMGGRMTRQISGAQPVVGVRQRFGTLTHGLFFVLGFTLFFVLFGLLTTAAVSSLTSLGVTEGDVRDGLARIGGSVVILFGLHVMGVLNRVFTWLLKQAARIDRSPYGNLISALIAIALIGAIYWLFVESWFLTLVVVLLLLLAFRDALKADTPGQFWSRIILRLQTVLYSDTRRQTQPTSQYGYLGSMFMGIVFSAGWTPCIGPIYGAVLTLASSGGSIAEAAPLLAAYSLGLGIPFLLTALLLDQAQGIFRRLQRNMRTIEAISGVFLLLVGVLVFSGQLQRLSTLGTEGSFADASINLENCLIGAVEGRVRWGNVPGCIGDGLKEDFYVAANKLAGQAAPPGAEASDAPESGFAELDAGAGDTSAALEAPALDSGAPDAPVGLQVGQRAPEFSAPNLDGEPVALSDFRGRPVLINFWATWCGPCREEMPDFQQLYDLRGADEFVVLAVNYLESPEQIAPFVEELGLSFPVVLDESGAVNDLYGDRIQGYPTSILIDGDGVIVRHFPGLVNAAQLIDALDELS